jgi:sugar-specific transcriptional regulator TrmB
MNDMHFEALKRLGLTDGEVAVYVALLELGPSTNSPIAKHSQLQASSVYYCLNSLIKKGFVTFSIRARRKHFEAVDPSLLPSVVDEKLKEVEETKHLIQEAIPALLSKKAFAKERNEANVYYGLKGIKTIFRKILASLKRGDAYESFVIEQRLDEPKELQLFFRSYNRDAKKKGIKIKLLAHQGLRPIFTKMYGTKFLKRYQEIRYTDKTIPVGTTIVKDSIIFFAWSEQPVAFEIINKKIADSYRRYFYDVWREAKR